MRKELAKHNEQRKRFRAKVVRFGKKTNFKGYSEETILLKEIVDISTGEAVTDHVWFTFSKGFADANIREGDCIEFDARVRQYKKGYVHKLMQTKKTTDYKLSHPTKIQVISNNL